MAVPSKNTSPDGVFPQIILSISSPVMWAIALPLPPPPTPVPPKDFAKLGLNS